MILSQEEGCASEYNSENITVTVSDELVDN